MQRFNYDFFVQLQVIDRTFFFFWFGIAITNWFNFFILCKSIDVCYGYRKIVVTANHWPFIDKRRTRKLVKVHIFIGLTIKLQRERNARITRVITNSLCAWAHTLCPSYVRYEIINMIPSFTLRGNGAKTIISSRNSF